MDERTFDRWQGQVDERMARTQDRVDVINGDMREIRDILTKMSLDLAVVKTKIAIWAAVGSLAGGAFASFILAQVG